MNIFITLKLNLMWGAISLNPKLYFYSNSSDKEGPWILTEEETEMNSKECEKERQKEFIFDSYVELEDKQIIAHVQKSLKRKSKAFKKWYFKQRKRLISKKKTRVFWIATKAKIVPLSNPNKVKPNPSWKDFRIRKQYEKIA